MRDVGIAEIQNFDVVPLRQGSDVLPAATPAVPPPWDRGKADGLVLFSELRVQLEEERAERKALEKELEACKKQMAEAGLL